MKSIENNSEAAEKMGKYHTVSSTTTVVSLNYSNLLIKRLNSLSFSEPEVLADLAIANQIGHSHSISSYLAAVTALVIMIIHSTFAFSFYIIHLIAVSVSNKLIIYLIN